MIIGDKIVTAHLLHENTPVSVEVVAIERGEIAWCWSGEMSRNWFVAHSHVNTYEFDRGGVYLVRGRVRKRDRGITWAPAWREDEVNLMRVTAALGTRV